jgi:membrane protein
MSTEPSNLRNRLVSLFFVIFLALLLIIIVGLNLILPSFVSSRYSDISWAVPATQILGSAITFIIFSIIFAAAFKWLPSADIAWSDVRYGAILTGILFVLGQLLLYLYFAKADFASAYGAAGAIPVLLVWIFYTMFILLTGAEFTHVYSRMYGSKRDEFYGMEASADSSERRDSEVTGSPAHQSQT